MQAQPLLAARAVAGQPEQHCRLAFPSPDGDAGIGTHCGSFSVQRFIAALQSRVLGRVLLTAAATPSTQVVVQENVARLPNGLVFVADKQYGGKGVRQGAGLRIVLGTEAWV